MRQIGPNAFPAEVREWRDTLALKVREHPLFAVAIMDVYMQIVAEVSGGDDEAIESILRSVGKAVRQRVQNTMQGAPK